MPYFKNRFSFKFLISFLLLVIIPSFLAAKDIEGITTYYIRLDIKSSAHRITGSKLTMVPAENDFRGENFSRFPISHHIMASPQESNQKLENLAKQNALTRVLEDHGLKSTETLNMDTIISYEGIIHTPVSLRIAPYDKTLEGFPYLAEISFAPLAFPDQWESLKQQFKIKEILSDFIMLFK